MIPTKPAGVAERTASGRMGSVCGSLVKLWVFCCTQLAQGLTFQIEPVSAVDQSIEHGIRDGGITEHLGMPQRLTGESLRYG